MTTPDDLDAFIAEQLKDPEFAKAWDRAAMSDWRAAYERGVAEGRRQATEGWERESSVRYSDGFVCSTGFTDEGARRTAAETDGELVSRLVGPWEPTEQAAPVKTWTPGYSPAEKLASLRAHPHGSACTCDDCTARDEAKDGAR